MRHLYQPASKRTSQTSAMRHKHAAPHMIVLPQEQALDGHAIRPCRHQALHQPGDRPVSGAAISNMDDQPPSLGPCGRSAPEARRA